MKTILNFFAIIVVVQSLHADTFDIGGSKINVPSPSGYVRITDDMPAVKRLVEQMADPLNDTLAFYIPEDSVPKALAGDMPKLDRYFMLKVNKKLKAYTASISEFSEMQSSVAAQNKKIFDEVKAKLPDYFDQISKNISKEFDTNIAFSVSQMIPLDPHYTSRDAFAYSMFINYGSKSEHDESKTIIAATSTFVNASGKIIFLYAYGVKEDLNWTRLSSESWQKSIITNNVSAPQTKTSVGIDWGKVAGKAITGGIIGVIVSLIAYLISKHKKKHGG